MDTLGQEYIETQKQIHRKFSNVEKRRILKKFEKASNKGNFIKENNLSSGLVYTWRKKFYTPPQNKVYVKKDFSVEIEQLKNIIADQAIDILALKTLIKKHDMKG